MKSMKLKISARDSRHTNPKVYLFAICSQWLPLAETVLSMTVETLPSPLQLTEESVERFMCRSLQDFQSLPHRTQMLKEGEVELLPCDVALFFITKTDHERSVFTIKRDWK